MQPVSWNPWINTQPLGSDRSSALPSDRFASTWRDAGWVPEANWSEKLQQASGHLQSEWAALGSVQKSDFGPVEALLSQSHLYRSVLQVELGSKVLGSVAQTINRLVNLA